MDLELDQFRDVDLVIDRANDSFVQKQFVSQGDYKGRTLTVQVTNNGNVGEVPGLTLNLNWHNEASGLTDLTAFSVVNKAASVFTIEYPEHMMTPGKVYASIQLIQDGKVTNLKEFELTVQRLAGQAVGIVEKAEYSALVAILADSNKFRTDIDSLSIEKADKSDLAQTNKSIVDLESTKADKADLEQSNKQILSLNNNKVDKNGAGQVRWANIAQDARAQISGDKVAIVGPGSVLTESVVDGVITRLKLSPDLSGFNQNRTEITYDDQNRVKMATEKNGDLVISRIELVYDALGRLQNITESANGKKIFTSIIYHTDGRISYLENEMGEQ